MNSRKRPLGTLLLLAILGLTPAKGQKSVYLKPFFANGTSIESISAPYKWLLVENNVGNYTGNLGDAGPCNADTPGFPNGCEWPSIRAIKATAPIYASGDHTEWGSSTNPLVVNKDGDYMVTVMAEGYRLCGGYFSVPPVTPPSDGKHVVQVACQKFPLPLGTIRMFVFNDNAPCNGQYDGPAEVPLKDFGIGVNDIEGPITEDYYGNSLLEIVSDENGIIVVPNMWPGRYDLDVGPPPYEGWIKTNTLEGGHGWDYWLYEGWDGYDNEFRVGNEQFPFAVAGYIREQDLIDHSASGVNVTGEVRTVSFWYPFNAAAEANSIFAKGVHDKGPLYNQDGFIVLSDLSGGGDMTVYAGFTNPDGTFAIPNVPPGNYMIAYFDITQKFILQIKTFAIMSSEAQPAVHNLGYLLLTGWYTEVHGFIFDDVNGNGMKDEGEPGIANGPFPIFRLRDGTQIDRGFQFAVPSSDPERLGFYDFSHTYPLTSWFSTNVFSDHYTTTGYSYKVENQVWHTVPNDTGGEQFDIALFGVPGVTTRLDIGFKLKTGGTTNKGSIYGAVHYDTTRVNQNAEEAVVENHEPGLPGIPVKLFQLANKNEVGQQICGSCTLNRTIGWKCTPQGKDKAKQVCEKFWLGYSGDSTRPPTPVMLWTSKDQTGFKNGQVVLPNKFEGTVTQSFKVPTDCTIFDDTGNPILFPDGQHVLPNPGTGVPCIETPLLGNQVGGWTSVDGNFHFENLEPGIYALQVEIPMDGKGTKRAYKIRTEDDINSYDSDQWIGTGAQCPSVNEQCPMPLDPKPPVYSYCQNVRMPCAGGSFTVGKVNNPSFKANGGSYLNNTKVRYCDIKIFRVEAGITTRATFSLFTDVPIPSRWKGLVLDDVTLQYNPRSVTYSELLGPAHMPIGIYDYLGVKLTDISTDANGFFEVLIPASRNLANAPSASGIMGAVWCMRGNDPGVPGFPSKVSPLLNYRSISACFEAVPGRIIPVDLAPVQIAAPIALPTGDIINAPCDLPQTKPELFNVHPEPICFDDDDDDNIFDVNCNITIHGRNLFVTTDPTVWLAVPTEQVGGPYASNGSAFERPDMNVTVVSKSNNTDYDEVVISIARPTAHFGMYQLELLNVDTQQQWFTGISIHLIGGNYKPRIYRVGDLAPIGPDFIGTPDIGPIQVALQTWETVAMSGNHQSGAIIMIHPNNLTFSNPDGAHIENLIMSYPAKLQGIGPGKDKDVATPETRGTQLDGAASGVGVVCQPPELFCDAQARIGWIDLVEIKASRLNDRSSIGNLALTEGQVLYVLSHEGEHTNGPGGEGWWNEAWTGGVDGCLITGGIQELGGAGAQPVPDLPQVSAVQGGGVSLHSYTRFFRITNNGINANSGTYAGAVRVGTPFLPSAKPGAGNSSNTQLTISRNNIRYNGGFNLAGAIGLFGGSDGYVVERNHICGNNGQEYGGGISHFGVSEGGRISQNWLLWNRAIDEGGGIIIASEIVAPNGADPVVPADAGAVVIDRNLIQGCVSGDDGGGIRFLNPGLSEYQVTNNIITHNVGLHEGGGVSLNDAPFVTFRGNTVMNNIVSGTSIESVQGELLASGLATSIISPPLKAKLDSLVAPYPWQSTLDFYPAGTFPGHSYPWDFSHPLLFANNIFWDNRVSDGIRDEIAVARAELRGLGMSPESEIWNFDIGSSTGGKLQPIYSVVQNCGDSTVTVASIDCLHNVSGGDPLVSGMIAWGSETLALSVRDWRLTPGAGNTFQVLADASLHDAGPIGDYTLTGSSSPAINIGPSTTTDPLLEFDFSGDLRRSSNKAFYDAGAEILYSVRRLHHFEPSLTTSSPHSKLSPHVKEISTPDTHSKASQHIMLISVPEAHSELSQPVEQVSMGETHSKLSQHVERNVIHGNHSESSQHANGRSVWRSFHPWSRLLQIMTFTAGFVLLLGKIIKTAKKMSPDCMDQIEDSDDTENPRVVEKQAPRRKAGENGQWNRMFIPILIALRLPREAGALDGPVFGTPIPSANFTKYIDSIYVPPVIDLRAIHPNGTFCTENDCMVNNTDCSIASHEFWMKESTQFWGVRKYDGTGNLSTPIFGYAVNETEDARFPGPTILVTKNCPVNITFHNALGTKQHILPIDRTTDCSNSRLDPDLCGGDNTTKPKNADGFVFPDPPDGEDRDFYCRCMSPNGSERRTTVHLHGGHADPEFDGHPQSWYTDYFSTTSTRDGGILFGETGVTASGETVMSGYNFYTNDQPACTLFYHDHSVGITRLNVYAGLAGLYVIEDSHKDALRNANKLPSSDYDFGLAFQDKIFQYNASMSDLAPLFFPVGLQDADFGSLPSFSILPEMFGNTMTVNGVIYPKMDVNTGSSYLFRLLNACDSRFLRLSWVIEDASGITEPDPLDITVVGTDQGLLPKPAVQKELLIGPGERYEIVVNFSRAADRYVTIYNSEITLIGPVVEGEDDRFMRFTVSSSSPPPVATIIPDWNETFDEKLKLLLEVAAPEHVCNNIRETVIDRREVYVTERTQFFSDPLVGGSGNRPLPLLGTKVAPFGFFFYQPATEYPVKNIPTIWDVINTSNDAHVIHLHQVRLKILHRQDVGISYGTLRGDFYRQYAKDPEPPEPYENGPKDSFISYPGQRISIITWFDIPGRYVWHCHILSHEDHMMIRELVVDSNYTLEEIVRNNRDKIKNQNNGKSPKP